MVFTINAVLPHIVHIIKNTTIIESNKTNGLFDNFFKIHILSAFKFGLDYSTIPFLMQ